MKKLFTKDKLPYWIMTALVVVFAALTIFWHYQYVLSMNRMEQYIKEMSQTIDKYQSDNMDLIDENNTLQSKIDSYDAQINEANEMKAKYISLGKKNEELQQKNNELEDKIESLHNKINELEDSNSSNTSSSSGGSGSYVGTDEYSDLYSTIVYWVPNGEVYHSTSNCPSLGRSKTIYSGTIEESGKGRRCKNCY